MINNVEISLEKLMNIHNDCEYLEYIISEYQTVFKDSDQSFINVFNKDQRSLFYYYFLLTQVSHGGFLQLIYNGDFDKIVNSSLKDSLKTWNIYGILNLLTDVEKDKHLIKEHLKHRESRSLDNLSLLYKKYPQFKRYDQLFLENNGLKDIVQVIKNHPDLFFKAI